MDAERHTMEPWRVTTEPPLRIMGASLTTQHTEPVVANLTSLDLANAHRIVACINACAGIPTEKLSGTVQETPTSEAAIK